MNKVKRKKIIILVVVVTFIVATVSTFTALGLTIWKGRSTEEWLELFSASLVFDKSNKNQSVEKRVFIEQNGVIIAEYNQLVELKEQLEGIIGHIASQEIYPQESSKEFDIFDEYYFVNETIFMQRKIKDEIIESRYSADLNTFWAIATDNMKDMKYALNKEVFEKFQISNKKNEPKLSATVYSNKQLDFLQDEALSKRVSNLNIEIIMTKELTLKSGNITYLLDGDKKVVTTMIKNVAEDIVIKDFVTT